MMTPFAKAFGVSSNPGQSQREEKLAMRRFSWSSEALGLGLLAVLAGCAAEPKAMAAAPSAASLSAPGNAGQAQGGMPAMSGPAMSGMHGGDMNAMMPHCAQMRSEAKPYAPIAATMRQMMGQCDQMDRSMGMAAPSRSR